MYFIQGKRTPLYALLFRIFGFLVAVSAISFQFITNSVVGKGFMANHTLAYFTLQTNILTALVFLWLICKTVFVVVKEKKLVQVQIPRSFHLACTFYITITMTVYWLILAPMLGVGDSPLTICNTLFLHLFTPLAAIADSVLFYEHGTLTKKYAFRWLTYPVLYLISVIIIANVSDVPYYRFKMGDRLIRLMYPYPFLDPQVVGTGGLIAAICILLVLVICFGLLYITVDNHIAAAIQKKNAPKGKTKAKKSGK